MSYRLGTTAYRAYFSPKGGGGIGLHLMCCYPSSNCPSTFQKEEEGRSHRLVSKVTLTPFQYSGRRKIGKDRLRFPRVKVPGKKKKKRRKKKGTLAWAACKLRAPNLTQGESTGWCWSPWSPFFTIVPFCVRRRGGKKEKKKRRCAVSSSTLDWEKRGGLELACSLVLSDC